MSATKSILSIDEFLKEVGSCGRYQILVIFIASLLFIIPAYQALLMIFTSFSPSWICSGENPFECNSTRIYSEGQPDFNLRCGMQSSSWKYTIERSHSIVSEFDLVCSREWLSYLSSSALFIGIGIGGIILGWLADKYGRKKILFGSYALECLVASAMGFSPDIYVFIVLRVIAGIFHGGVMLCNIVLSVELVGPKHRVLAGLMVWETWGVAACFLSLQSYYILDWRVLYKVLSIPYIVVVIGALYFPESVRWHRSQNNLKEAEKILQKIAKVNKREFPWHASLQQVEIIDEEKSGSFRDLFTTWRASLRVFLVGFMWFTCECLYYGVTLTFSGFGGSLHRDFVILTVAELIANLIFIWLINRFGRRYNGVGGLAVTSACLVLSGILLHANVKVNSVNIIIGVSTKVFTLLSWCAMEIWSAELFPTCSRSKAMGIFFVTSQFGAALSPWIAKGLLQFHATSPFFVLGFLALLCLVFILFLPETKGKVMEDVIVSKLKDKEENTTKDEETNLIFLDKKTVDNFDSVKNSL